MSLGILRQDVVDIIGRHQLHGKLPAHTHQPLIDGFLGRDPVILQLQKEVSLSENCFIPPCRSAGLLIHSPCQITLHLTGQAGT